MAEDVWWYVRMRLTGCGVGDSGGDVTRFMKGSVVVAILLHIGLHVFMLSTVRGTHLIPTTCQFCRYLTAR